MKQYKKINYDEIKDETFEVKSYLKSLSLPQARLRMRLRAGMVGSVKFNFQSDKKFTEVNWRCSCGQIDSQRHIENNCVKYDDLRDKFDTKDDLGLVSFFDAVLKRREEEE